MGSPQPSRSHPEVGCFPAQPSMLQHPSRTAPGSHMLLEAVQGLLLQSSPAAKHPLPSSIQGLPATREGNLLCPAQWDLLVPQSSELTGWHQLEETS